MNPSNPVMADVAAREWEDLRKQVLADHEKRASFRKLSWAVYLLFVGLVFVGFVVAVEKFADAERRTADSIRTLNTDLAAAMARSAALDAQLGITREELTKISKTEAAQLRVSLDALEARLNTIKLTPGPQGRQGVKGEPGAKGDAGDKGDKPMTSKAVMSDERRDGTEASVVAFWRADASNLWWHGLVTVPPRVARARWQAAKNGDKNFHIDSTYEDWAREWLDLSAIGASRASWNHFWHDEVDTTRMPRTFLRSLVHVAQLDWKLGDGNGRDGQHIAHLADVDLFITADKRYAWTMRMLKSWFPGPLGLVALIRGVESPVGHIRRALELARAGVVSTEVDGIAMM